jgi:NitT/TauT family transport system ATP-binding protein
LSLRLECQGISKLYESPNGPLSVLEDVSFRVEDHEFVSIVGPSGCGKTTLLKLIAGLMEPTSGEITSTGVAANGRPQSALVFQDHGLFPWMSVLENVAFGLEMIGVARPERLDRASAFVERVGLGQFASSYPHQLSVGMQQRVGIIRAFVTDAPMLLMDEPFGALDSQTRIVLQEELLRIWRDQRQIVLFVTHDLDEAVRLGDRILVMTGRPGRIREEIPVPIPRPRELSKRVPTEVADIKWHVWELLEHEVRKGLWIPD